MESLARGVEKGFSGFATRTTKRTTVLDAKLVEKFLRIAVCLGFCDRTGRAPSRNSRLSSAANYNRSENPAVQKPSRRIAFWVGTVVPAVGQVNDQLLLYFRGPIQNDRQRRRTRLN